MNTSFAWGASTDEPQKIKIGGAGYNASTQSFEIQLDAKFGIATAGERAGFTISSVVLVLDSGGNELAQVTGEAPVEMASGSGGSDLVPLVPQSIPWDRNRGTFTGIVTLEISSRLEKNGRPVTRAADTHTESGIDIGGGRTDILPAGLSNIEPPATAASTFLPWSVIISMSVFLVIGRWLKKSSVS